jgi:putative DNA primase/helicase
LLARSANKVTGYAKTTTRDRDIVRRRWLPVDLDPVRPAGIPSTRDEHAASLARAIDIFESLSGRGWPSPVVIDSGNGAYLLYHVDLPNDEASTTLVENCLKALAAEFDDAVVKVDQTMSNASRIIRVPGTTNRKGSGTADRPHRRSRVMLAPAEVEVVSADLLAALASTVAGEPESTPAADVWRDGFDLEAFIAECLPDARGPKLRADGRSVWTIETCPFNGEHARGEAFVGRMPSGALFAGCQHDSCTWKWPDLRAKLAPRDDGTATADAEADLANARLLAARFGDRLRHVVRWRKWLVWDGTRWAYDETGEAARCAKAVADELPKTGSRGGAARAQTRPGIEAMLVLAATEPGIAVAPSMLDADPYLLNVANGTLDLRTAELRPYNRDDLLTKVCAAEYRPDAEAPEFVKFLERVQPDEAMRDFLARLFGHALLGKVVEHLLPVFYGLGANGKTTLVEAVAATLGDYADTIEPGLLIDRGEVHPTGIADLFKLRLAITHETDEGRRLAEGTVKRLTGGDRVKARRMREDFWSFDPSHSIVMHTNHKPIVRGTDEGIWRRLRFVPFDVVIPEVERDGKLPERLAVEADGILTWMVAGYRQWQDRGLADPKQVTDATSAFRGESDLLALFLDERTVAEATATVRSSELFEAWCRWCRRENIDAGTQTAFSRNLTERGHAKTKRDGVMVWRGVRLDEDSGRCVDCAPGPGVDLFCLSCQLEGLP